MTGRHAAGTPIGDAARDTTAPPYIGKHRKQCAYLLAYDCRCDNPAFCPILRSPPGAYPLRLPDEAAEFAARVAEWDRWLEPDYDLDHQDDPDGI